MSKKPDGGSAFSRSDEVGLHRAIPGMSLRDWFAGMAMQRLLIVAGDAISKMDRPTCKNCWHGSLLKWPTP
jgi:hypothetical protein